MPQDKQNLLAKLKIKEFKSIPLLNSGILQTIVCHFLPKGKIIQSTKRHQVKLSDGDQLLLSELRPPKWQKGNRIVVLFHGLAGCEQSNYMVRIGRKLYQKNYLVILVNLRSCGPGLHLAKNPYHSGRSEDARTVLQYLLKNYPDSPVTQIGFSLSANITLKMLGEDAGKSVSNLDSAIAVSPPIDLKQSAQKMTQINKIFDKHFLKLLIKQVRTIEADIQENQKTYFPKEMNLIDFDNLYTAPKSGFKDANDYYEKCSSKHFVEKIKLKTLIIHSWDDPVVDISDISKLKIPKNIDLILNSRGGHVGFFSSSGFWMDQVVCSWIEKMIDHK